MVTKCPPAGMSASISVVAEFMPEEDSSASSAPSRAHSFSSAARVVGLPYRPYSKLEWVPSCAARWRERRRGSRRTARLEADQLGRVLERVRARLHDGHGQRVGHNGPHAPLAWVVS